MHRVSIGRKDMLCIFPTTQLCHSPPENREFTERMTEIVFVAPMGAGLEA